MTYSEFSFLTVPLRAEMVLANNKILCKRQLAGEGGIISGWKSTASYCMKKAEGQSPLLRPLPFSER